MSLPWSEAPAGHGVQNCSPFTATPSLLCFQVLPAPDGFFLVPTGLRTPPPPQAAAAALAPRGYWPETPVPGMAQAIPQGSAARSHRAKRTWNYSLLQKDRGNKETVIGVTLSGQRCLCEVKVSWKRSWSQYNACCLTRQKTNNVKKIWNLFAWQCHRLVGDTGAVRKGVDVSVRNGIGRLWLDYGLLDVLEEGIERVHSKARVTVI